MTRTRLALAIILLAVGLSAPAAGPGGLFGRKSAIDAPRVRQLAEILRSERDEKNRVAAVAELGTADPRLHPDVIPTIIAALLRDPAPTVRLNAAQVIARFNVVFPTAGLALETAAESDAAPAVRDTARQALWDYHLIGYRSAQGFGGFATQSPEPPIAKPAGPAEPVTTEPLATLVVPVVGAVPRPTLALLPPTGPPPGPRVSVSLRAVTSGLLSAVPPHPNLTVEPPVAPLIATMMPPVANGSEPPIRARWPEPIWTGKAPPVALELPGIVPPPGPIPGATALPDQTAEPPLARRKR